MSEAKRFILATDASEVEVWVSVDAIEWIQREWCSDRRVQIGVRGIDRTLTVEGPTVADVAARLGVTLEPPPKPREAAQG